MMIYFWSVFMKLCDFMIQNTELFNKISISVNFSNRIVCKFFFQVYKSQRFRAGKGKMRNRRRIQRKGPLVVYHKDQGTN